jgi:hypothetical protein
MKFKILVFLLLISGLTCMSSYPAMACEIIATVYGGTVCLPEQSMNIPDPSQDKEHIWPIIMQNAVTLKFGSALAPTTEEKEKLTQQFRQACVEIVKNLSKKLEKTDFIINGKLDTESFRHHQACQNENPTLEDLKTDPRYFFFENWKMNQVLFLHYGGRTAFQQAGAEAHDALRKFYADMKTEGHLKLAPPYADSFDYMERYLNQHFIYISEEESRPYFKQFWLFQSNLK